MSQDHTIKTLGFWTLTALVAGNMIGSGVFMLPASLAAFGSIGIFAWLITAAGTMVLAIVFARLSRLLPRTGGPYAYCREAYGDFIGFQVAYNYWIALWVGNAAIVVTLVSYLGVFWPQLDTNPWLSFITSLGFIWAITFINILGVKEAGRTQIITTVLKLIPLLIIATVGLLFIQKPNLMHFNVSGKSDFVALSGAATLTMWAFIGFESATVPAEHVIDPRRNIPRATIVGTSVAALVYILSTIAIMGIVPMQQLAHSTSPFADAANLMFGPWAHWVIAAAAVVACFGTLNGWILMQGQIPLAAAKDGLFPRQFEKTNKAGSPVVGLIVSSVLISILLAMRYGATLVDQFTMISLLATLASLIPYIYTSVAEIMFYIKEREKFNHKRLTGSAILGMVAFIYTYWLIYGAGLQIVFYGVLLLLSSIPVYLFLQMKSIEPQNE
ncbi:MAG: amino acid permease [Gammaproteobacteria bacterium]|nr:amino acid permease [Gammaproteobacteria bacterium]